MPDNGGSRLNKGLREWLNRLDVDRRPPYSVEVRGQSLRVLKHLKKRPTVRRRGRKVCLPACGGHIGRLQFATSRTHFGCRRPFRHP